jgi:hypothetical protein
LVTTAFPESPLHILAVVPVVTTASFANFAPAHVFFDILAPIVEDEAEDFAKDVIGFIVPFTRYDMGTKLRVLLERKRAYSVCMKARSVGCCCAWKPLLYFSSVEGNPQFFVLACAFGQPCMLNISPQGSASAVVQVTVKFSDRLVVLTR